MGGRRHQKLTSQKKKTVYRPPAPLHQYLWVYYLYCLFDVNLSVWFALCGIITITWYWSNDIYTDYWFNDKTDFMVNLIIYIFLIIVTTTRIQIRIRSDSFDSIQRCIIRGRTESLRGCDNNRTLTVQVETEFEYMPRGNIDQNSPLRSKNKIDDIQKRILGSNDKNIEGYFIVNSVFSLHFEFYKFNWYESKFFNCISIGYSMYVYVIYTSHFLHRKVQIKRIIEQRKSRENQSKSTTRSTK